MQYQQLFSELHAWVPKIPPQLAERCIQRAWRDIRDSRLWSFLVRDTVIAVPDALTVGTVIASNGSDQVVGDATAAAAWDLISNADFITRQFRVGSGPIYNIASYTSPNITLDRVYSETSVTAGVYLIYKCYYPAPDNFLRWTSIFDPINGYTISTDRVKSELDLRDPNRGATGQPLVLASFKYDTTEATTGWIFELYPHPLTQLSYPALYQIRGIDFAARTEEQPNIIPDEVLIHRAKFWAYEWAMANATNTAVNWQYLRSQADADYRRDLFKAQKQDEEIFSQNYIEPYPFNRFRRLSYDGNYAQNHAPSMSWSW